MAEGEVTCGGGKNFGGCIVFSRCAVAGGPLDGPRATIFGRFGEDEGNYRRTVTR